jgi:hypothetical protein
MSFNKRILGVIVGLGLVAVMLKTEMNLNETVINPNFVSSGAGRREQREILTHTSEIPKNDDF